MENVTKTDQQTPAPFMHPGIKITLYSVLLICSLVGNILVIAVIFANASLRTKFNYLILNMAFSDLAIPLLAIPLKIIELARGRESEWLVGGQFGNILCKLCFFFTDISPGVSMLSLVVIAINRFIAIAYPLRIKTSGKTRILWLIASTWIISMAIFAPYFYTFRIVQSPDYLKCLFSWSPHFDEKKANAILHGICVIVLFCIPFIAITVLYSILILKIYQNSKGVQNMLNNQQARFRERRNKQIFYISMVVVVVFALFWGPFFGFLFTLNFVWGYDVPAYVNVQKIFFIVNFLGYANAAINPLMYFVLMKNFRRGLKKLLGLKSYDPVPQTTICLNTRILNSTRHHSVKRLSGEQ